VVKRRYQRSLFRLHNWSANYNQNIGERSLFHGDELLAGCDLGADPRRLLGAQVSGLDTSGREYRHCKSVVIGG
jgi:hypothetical protein